MERPYEHAKLRSTHVSIEDEINDLPTDERNTMIQNNTQPNTIQQRDNDNEIDIESPYMSDAEITNEQALEELQLVTMTTLWKCKDARIFDCIKTNAVKMGVDVTYEQTDL